MNLRVVDGIEILDYGTSNMHRLLSDGNIGFKAENLTVVILSCNRADATIKLLKSIQSQCKDFKGKVLIADNGSDEESLKKLKKEIANIQLECNLYEFGQNLGVAKGRNSAVKYVKTDWIMFLDNDIYFIKDMFSKIQESIAKLGCKFLNLPLLRYDGNYIYSFGGNIYLSDDNGNIHIGCGSTYEQTKIEENTKVDDCLATFLFGGASVVNKDCFLECGGFDEGMFIGYEDIDFSIQIFRKGYKIGCCGELGLIHDHQKAENESDIEYEKKRFSNKLIYESAMYFKKKHGFSVWSKVTEEWLKQRETELGLQSSEKITKQEEIRKPRIALIIDSRGWAFDNIANNIVKYLSNEFEFKKIYMSDIPGDNIVLLMYACEDCDLVHFLWRGYLSFIDGENAKWYLSYYGRDVEQFKVNIMKKMYITAGVYDHKYLDNEIEITQNIMKYINKYTVSSKKLFDIYDNLKLGIPMVEITDGVDDKLFHPINIERFDKIKNRKIIVGWVGNSKFDSENNEDYKGFNTIIKPAIWQLKNEGYNIELYSADRADKYIPHNEMPEYYSKIDLYVCASINEGTPNPILEAMACGVPVISTDVGIVREVLGDKQLRYVLEERSVECLKNRMKLFLDDIDSINELIDENLNQIKKWTWQKKTEEFRVFFRECIEEKNSMIT